MHDFVLLITLYYCNNSYCQLLHYIDQSSIPNSIPTVNTTNGIMINWDPVQLEDCSMNYTTVAYTVTVTRAGGHEEGMVALSGETVAIINNLKPMLDYNVSIRAMTVSNTNSGTYSCNIGSYPEITFSTPTSTSTSGSSEPGQKSKFEQH